MIGAACEIEQTGAFDVVDKMVELFTQGMLPVRDDSGGRALNRYYWQAESRLDAAARASLYARALGRGDTGNTDAQPNVQFEQLMMRFVSALVRYDSTLQVSNVVTTDGRDRLGSSEQVRKAAQDFAANASLFGWGFTVFAARKLSQHIDSSSTSSDRRPCSGRTASPAPGSSSNGSPPSSSARHRRSSSTAPAPRPSRTCWTCWPSTPPSCPAPVAVKRFLPNIDDLRGVNQATSSTVSVVDYERMVSAANNLLAVGGVTDDEIARFSAARRQHAPRGPIPMVGDDNGHRAAPTSTRSASSSPGPARHSCSSCCPPATARSG